MNILVTINRNYIEPLLVMLYSLIQNNKTDIVVYVLHNDLNKEDRNYIKENVNSKVIFIRVDDDKLKQAPTFKKFPITMYYRLFAPIYLPKSVEKILYLDPDIIVKGDLSSLYNMDLKENLFAGATHVAWYVKVFNDLRLHISYKDIYLNSGVLLINVKEYRKVQNIEEIYEYIRKNKRKLFMPDQDIISKLYKNKIKEIDASIYNFSLNLLKKYSKEYVKDHTKIIHYCGKEKPWKKDSKHKLKSYYQRYEKERKEKEVSGLTK